MRAAASEALAAAVQNNPRAQAAAGAAGALRALMAAVHADVDATARTKVKGRGSLSGQGGPPFASDNL